MLASIVLLFRRIPRKVKDVEGPSTLDDLIGALMLLHNVNIDCKFSEHCDEFAGPAVKKSSR